MTSVSEKIAFCLSGRDCCVTKSAENLYFLAMHVFATKAGIAVLAATIALAPPAVFASERSGDVRVHERPLVNLINKASNWKTNGGVSIASDGTITLTENGSESEHAYTDVAVAGRGGDFAVLIAYTKAERVRTNDITGLPYLYAYAMNKDGKILAYLQGQQMLHAGKSGEWQVNHGTFRLPAGTTTVRYFVEQAEKQGSAKKGDDAMFKKTALYVVENASRTQDAVRNYRSSLAQIK